MKNTNQLSISKRNHNVYKCRGHFHVYKNLNLAIWPISILRILRTSLSVCWSNISIVRCLVPDCNICEILYTMRHGRVSRSTRTYFSSYIYRSDKMVLPFFLYREIDSSIFLYWPVDPGRDRTSRHIRAVKNCGACRLSRFCQLTLCTCKIYKRSACL